MQKIGFDDICISSITLMELMIGMGNKKELAMLKAKIKYYEIIHINQHISKVSTEIIETYKLSHGILIPDALIAATTVVYGIPLFTYNLKDFVFTDDLIIYNA